MLNPFIIDQIRRREKEAEAASQQIQLELPKPDPQFNPAEEQESERGVVIIDVWDSSL